MQSFIRDQTDQLQMMETTTISNLRCSMLVRHTAPSAVNSENVCTLEPPGEGICGGDSGSPLVRQGALVGVTSWMRSPCGSGPSVYVRVSHHINWINEHMWKLNKSFRKTWKLIHARLGGVGESFFCRVQHKQSNKYLQFKPNSDLLSLSTRRARKCYA